MREADDACMRDAYIVVDTLAALQESGDLASPLANHTIRESQIVLLNDQASQNRAAPRTGKTVFKSVGVAHADLAAAEYIYYAG